MFNEPLDVFLYVPLVSLTEAASRVRTSQADQEHVPANRRHRLRHHWRARVGPIIQQAQARDKRVKSQQEQVHTAHRTLCSHILSGIERSSNKSKSTQRTDLCKHLRRRVQCNECKGSARCEHLRVRAQCKECNGSAIVRAQCKECNGSAICIHLRQRSTCKHCMGTSICVHRHQKHRCKHCKHGDTVLVEGSEVETFVDIVNDVDLVDDFVPVLFDILWDDT